MRVCCRRNEVEDLLGGDLEGVGARNRVAAGQAACLDSLMRPSQRVVRTSRKSSERSVVSLLAVVLASMGAVPLAMAKRALVS